MCAYDALIAAPNATLLDFPMLLARPVADHHSTSMADAALLAYAQLAILWWINTAVRRARRQQQLGTLSSLSGGFSARASHTGSLTIPITLFADTSFDPLAADRSGYHFLRQQLRQWQELRRRLCLRGHA